MIGVDAVEQMLCEHAGIDRSMVPLAETERLFHLALAVWMDGTNQRPLVDQRPDLLEQKLEEVRGSIRDIILQIEGLDGWAVAVARRDKPRKETEAAADVTALISALERAESVPQEEWPDIAAVRHLRDLEEGLKRPIETLIKRGAGLSDGKGTKPNLVARRVALSAGRALAELTGRPPSYWRDGTAFAKLTAALFHAFSIKADTRRACEWALSELGKSG